MCQDSCYHQPDSSRFWVIPNFHKKTPLRWFLGDDVTGSIISTPGWMEECQCLQSWHLWISNLGGTPVHLWNMSQGNGYNTKLVVGGCWYCSTKHAVKVMKAFMDLPRIEETTWGRRFGREIVCPNLIPQKKALWKWGKKSMEIYTLW